jgi:hypothetical protein
MLLALPTHLMFPKFTMKNDTKPKQGGGELLPYFLPNPYLEF